jgi:membrane-bound lytic murein transglycosylase D
MRLLLLGTFLIAIATTIVAQNRPIQLRADQQQLDLLDSNTLFFYNKRVANTPSGDLNVFGFDELDVPIYADSIYAKRLQMMETVIPMEYNSYVRNYIDMYTIKRRRLVSRMLSWSKYYFPIFEEALDKANMPIELKYMAVIESALNPNAVSHMGAAGMWQFMPATGRMYGLKTGSTYDERRDVVKSTEAAIKYLKNSYAIYGDWLLVIASYNCGPGNVNKAIKRAGGNKNFWEIQQYLPAETRGYVPAFVAAAYAMEYAHAHNIYPDDEVMFTRYTDTIQISSQFHLRTLALHLDMTVEELMKYNPALRTPNLPFSPTGITLTLPYHKTQQLASMLADSSFKQMHDQLAKSQPRTQPNANQLAVKGYHTVKSGETLSSISKRYGVTVDQLKSWNKMSTTRLAVGQKLVVKVNRG